MKKSTRIILTIVLLVAITFIRIIKQNLDDYSTGYSLLSILFWVGIFVALCLWVPLMGDKSKKEIQDREFGEENNTHHESYASNQTSTERDTNGNQSTSGSYILIGDEYDELLLKELRNLCSPQNYMSPYDYNKVRIANEIYPLLFRDGCTHEDIIAIRERAIRELGVAIDTTALYRALLYACNPTRYMEPYDSEKVGIANELYNKILENRSDIVALERIRDEAIEKGLIEFLPSYVGENRQKVLFTWSQNNGDRLIRLIVGSSSGLYSFVENTDKSWSNWRVFATVKPTLDDVPIGRGTSFTDVNDGNATYRINKLDLSLEAYYLDNLVATATNI